MKYSRRDFLKILAGGGRWDWIEIKKSTYKRITAIGDSITAGQDELAAPKWIYRAMHIWNSGRTSVFDRALGGKGVIWDMQYQVREAAGDDADLIFIEMDTNDHVLEPEFQGEYVIELDHLKASNVRARIICMEILDRTFYNTYRDAINAAATRAAAISHCEYWDTTGWIDPTKGVDTIEGLHPNECGQQKIANRVLAKL